MRISATWKNWIIVKKRRRLSVWQQPMWNKRQLIHRPLLPLDQLRRLPRPDLRPAWRPHSNTSTSTIRARFIPSPRRRKKRHLQPLPMESPASDVELVWIQVREFKFRATSLPPTILPKHTKQKFPSDELYLSWLSLFYCAFYLIFPPHPDAKKKKVFLKHFICFYFFLNKIYTKLILHDEHSKHVDTLFLGSFRTIRHHFHSFFFFSSLLHFRVVVVVAFRHYIIAQVPPLFILQSTEFSHYYYFLSFFMIITVITLLLRMI